MKILQINTVCGYGSTGRITVDLYQVLEEQGHDCCIVYGRKKAPQEIKTIKIGRKLDYCLHALYTRLTDKTGFFSKAATKKCIDDIKKYDPDVIHLHNLHGYYINIELLFDYLKEAKKPVVWTLHDCWAFTGRCGYFDFIGCEQWKTGCKNCTVKKRSPKSYLMNRSKWNFINKKKLFTSINNMTIVTPSYWLAGLVEQSFLAKYPVNVINNGIDLDVFKPTKSQFRKKYALEEKQIVLGVANIWDQRKGLDAFMKLSKKLDESYQVVLVGLSKKQIKKLPENVIGIERTQSVKELAEIYTAADVFVNPSREETMGLVTVEALACGTPVVVYDATAVPEFVDETCGIVVKKGDVKALQKAIVSCESRGFKKEECLKRSLLYEKRKKFGEYVVIFNLQKDKI